jgi:hypothetical protein
VLHVVSGLASDANEKHNHRPTSWLIHVPLHKLSAIRLQVLNIAQAAGRRLSPRQRRCPPPAAHRQVRTPQPRSARHQYPHNFLFTKSRALHCS